MVTPMGGQEEGGRKGWMDVCGEEVLSLSGRVYLDVTSSVGMLCLSLLGS